MSARREFRRALRAGLWTHRLGAALAGFLRVAAHGLAGLTALAAADYFLAFDPAPLRALGRVLLAALGAELLVRCVRAFAIPARAFARHADRASGGRRGEVLSACELERAEAPEGLGAFLVDRGLARAAEILRGLGTLRRLPGAELRAAGRRLAWCGAVAALGLGAPLPVSRVVLARIFQPGADIPPYSRLRFEVDPAAPRVIYGGTAELAARLSGAPWRGPVWLVTRRGAETGRAACFQEAGGRHAQRLEKLVEPVEFCFTAGRARSRWHRVDLILDPNIVAARVTVRPPAYTGRPSQEFLAGAQKLAGLRGSTVELDLTSNRPLEGGVVSIRGGDGPGLEVRGERRGLHRVIFQWRLESRAAVEAVVTDVQGTRNQRPLRLEQVALDDEAPRIAVTDPAGFALATPRARLPVAGYAEDDIGLLRVDLVRGVTGYRDRAEQVGPQGREAKVAFRRELDLGRLGVEPGQELEFYAEAADTNPTLAGLAASDVVRVRIISEEDYAAMLRTRVGAEEFIARFREARETLDRLVEELKTFEEKSKSGDLSDAERAQRWEALKRQNEEAAKAFRRLAADFPVFDAENALQESLNQAAATLEEHAEWMKSVAFREGMERTVANMLDRLGARQQQIGQQARDAEEIAKVARVMEQAARYQRIIAAQERLVRRLERMKDAESSDRATMQMLRERQEENRRELLGLRDDLRARAAELPDEFLELRESAEKFAGAIDQLEIPPAMAEAAAGAANQDLPTARRQATMALERLQKLLSEDQQGNSPFGGMCQGKPKFQVNKSMQQTLSQMLGAWCMGMGQRPGQGQGTGPGAGGDSDDGSFGEGMSPLNVPTYGPGRAMAPAGGAGRDGVGGPGRAGGGVVQPRDREAAATVDPLEMERRSIQPGRAPEKYRDALQRYFGKDTEP